MFTKTPREELIQKINSSLNKIENEYLSFIENRDINLKNYEQYVPPNTLSIELRLKVEEKVVKQYSKWKVGDKVNITTTKYLATGEIDEIKQVDAIIERCFIIKTNTQYCFDYRLKSIGDNIIFSHRLQNLDYKDHPNLMFTVEVKSLN